MNEENEEELVEGKKSSLQSPAHSALGRLAGLPIPLSPLSLLTNCNRGRQSTHIIRYL